MANPVADVLVVSDLHAMSPDVNVARFKQFVDLHPARKLVLAGDILDIYMWRHGRGKIDTAPGVALLEYLIELADIGVEMVILPGNHDMDWAWLAGGVAIPRRYKKSVYPEVMSALLGDLLTYSNVSVSNVHEVGNALIVHGHEGWQGDWLWRMSEWGDRATAYKLVGRQFRRKVMSSVPMRDKMVQGHGFYRRLASWAKRHGQMHVIHGHTHCEGRRMRGGVVLDCLPAWRPSEGPGGGMILRDGVWLRVKVDG